MAQDRFQVIQLEVDDDIPVIRDRLEWAEAEVVVLVVPARNHTLRSLVNLKLVTRLARNAGRRMALVTDDPHVLEISREVRELVIFNSLKRAQKSNWLPRAGLPPAAGSGTAPAEGMAIPPVIPSQPKAPPVEVQIEQAAGDVPGVELPVRPLKGVPRPRHLPFFQPPPIRAALGWRSIRHRLLSAAGFLVLLLVLAGMMAVVVMFTYPEGQVQVKPASRPVRAELVVRADPKAEKIDYATLDIPARVTQVELHHVGRMPPSSTSDMPTERATGLVTFINRSDQDVTIPISTTLTTSSGTTVRFLTAFTVTIGSALRSGVQVPVTAVDPGPIGNVAAGQINRVPDPVLGRQVSVVNETPTSGGKVAPAGVVTRADKDRLWAMVLQQLHQEGYSKLSAELGEQAFIPPESVVVLPLEGTYQPSLDGEVTDLLTLEMQAVVRGTVIGGQNANQLALAALQAQVPAGYRLDAVSLQFIAGEVVSVGDPAPTRSGQAPTRSGQAVSFKMRASGIARAQIDAGQVVSEVRGLPLDKAQQVLGQRFPLAGTPSVAVEPDWLGRLPWLPFRITVTVSD